MRIILNLTAGLCVLSFGGVATADSRDLTLTTTDDVSIRATLSLPEDLAGQAAAIILIHQGGSNRHEWNTLTPQLLDQGYIVLAYDVRGHGDSDPVDSIRKLFNDPDLAPLDLAAAITYLADLPEVDADRLAVIGASIGANLAAMASSEMPIKTAVAISGKTSATFNLAGKADLAMKSIFFIASAEDQSGKRATWATELFEQTGAPRRLEIVANSRHHGVGIFEDEPELQQRIVVWLQTTL